MAKRFWTKWEPRLWLSDPALSRCPAWVRGIWMDLLCAMMESGAAGEITGTIEELARIARCTPEELRNAAVILASSMTAELRQHEGKMTLVNRKMRRESRERQLANERQLRYARRKRDSEMTAEKTPESQQTHPVESKSESESPLSPLPENGQRQPTEFLAENESEQSAEEGYGSMSDELLHIARDAGAEFNISPAKVPELNEWIKLVGYPLARECLDEAQAKKGISGFRAIQYIQPMSISRKAESDLRSKRPPHLRGGVAVRQDR